MKFEWDEAKRAANIKKHGVDFVDAARLMLNGPYVSESRNSGTDAQRFIAINEMEGIVYTAVYAIREDVYRIISVRRASDDERKTFRIFHGRRDSSDEKQNGF